MEFKSEQKYARISPTKVRPLIGLVKSMDIEKSLEVLPLVPKRGAMFLAKVIKSAVANASQKGFTVSDLKFKEIVANEGPRLKRGRPISRGMWHPYVRKTSHIRVVLQTKNKDEDSAKAISREKVKESKKSKTEKKYKDDNKKSLGATSKKENKSKKGKRSIKSRKSDLKGK